MKLIVGNSLIILSLFVYTACAQEHGQQANQSMQPAAQHQSHEEHSLSVDSIPVELLTKPIALRAGVGKVNDAVTTASKEAQAFYNQGMAYLHAYVWIEAARSFNQALKLDDKLAMAHLGLYRAYIGLNINASAREALDKAQQLMMNASPRERRRILAHAKQFDAITDINNTAKHEAYKKALDDALLTDANDVELLLLRGNAEEGVPATGRGQRGLEGSRKFYLKAVEFAPEHAGAHHFLTHTYENMGKVNEALKHGELTAKYAPEVPHMRHMYGHDLRRVGRIKEAIAEFNKADELQRAYFVSEQISPEYDWHNQHNLDLLSTCYQHQGQMKRAEEIMRQAFNLPSFMEAEAYNKKEYPAFLLARGRTDEALEAANRLIKTKWEIVQAVGYIMTSHIQMTKNKLPEASAAAKNALQVLQNSGKKFTLINNDLAVLQGVFFLRTGQKEKGEAVLRQAVQKIRAEQGPDNWTQALFQLEAIARVAREVGNWELAEFITAQMLDHDANYGGAHYAMALVYEHQGDKAKAIAALTLAEKLWSDADTDLPELAAIKIKLVELRK
ncbi:MAG: hypothetical protein AB1757_08135 [Acidobacteriota bacterium]